MSVDKTKALLKFGTQAFRAARFEEARSAFRQAADLAKAAKAERLQAQALARLLNAMGYMGKAGELQDEILSTLSGAMKQWSDVPAVLVMQSCALRMMKPDVVPRLIAGWIEDAKKFPADQAAWVEFEAHMLKISVS